MLPPTHRLTSPAEFREVVRRGARTGGPLLVVHLLVRPDASDSTARAGFVVSKAVGGAVIRTRVKRRLRHLVADRLEALPAGSLLVLRAQPGAARASHPELASELDRSLERCLERVTDTGVPA